MLQTQSCKPWKKATFCAYSYFIGMKFNKDAKVWTYLPIAPSPLNLCKLKSSCPSFKIWLWGVNLLFNLALNTFHGKLPIRFGSTSFCVIHHSNAWSFKRDYADLNRSTSVLITWDSKWVSTWIAHYLTLFALVSFLVKGFDIWVFMAFAASSFGPTPFSFCFLQFQGQLHVGIPFANYKCL